MIDHVITAAGIVFILAVGYIFGKDAGRRQRMWGALETIKERDAFEREARIYRSSLENIVQSLTEHSDPSDTGTQRQLRHLKSVLDAGTATHDRFNTKEPHG